MVRHRAGDCELRLEVRNGASLTDLVDSVGSEPPSSSLSAFTELPEESPSPAVMLLNGVLAGLDPYSTVFDSRGKTEHTIQFRGKLAGIGAKSVSAATR